VTDANNCLWVFCNDAEHEEQFYNDVIRYVRGEEHNLWLGSVGMIKADIAKRLIAEHPSSRCLNVTPALPCE
jgi:hypothetical protein